MSDLRSALTTDLLGHEGEVLRAYDDATGRVVNPGDTVKGWLTIGVGRNLVGRGITQDESRYLLANDIAVVERELDQLLGLWRQWSPARQLAIMELTFNMGVARFIAGWPNTVTAMREGRWADVARGLLGSKWRKQVGEVRAQHIIRLIVTGVIA